MATTANNHQATPDLNGFVATITCPSSVMQNPASYDVISTMTKILRSKITKIPEIGIVCGSGLGHLCNKITQKESISYSEIPGMPISTVQGHAGNFLVGNLRGKAVIAMQGRIHQYEGYNAQQVSIPIRVMHLLGVKVLFITNAAGAINDHFSLGDIVLIKDHIYLPGFVGQGPLCGPNEEKFGPRFVNLQNTYDKKLRHLAWQLGQKMSLRMHQGVYAMVTGPHYETPSECRFLRALGADLVGMSTAPEAIAARHCNMKVLAFSIVTNCANFDCDNDSAEVNDLHADVLKIVNENCEKITEFVAQLTSLL